MQPLLTYIQVDTPNQQIRTAQPTVMPPPAPQAVELHVDPLPPVVAGKAITLSAALMTTTGAPVPDVVVVLFFQSEPLQRRRTDAAGRVTFSLPKDWPPAVYKFGLLVAGNEAYEGAIAVAEVVIESIQSTIQVIPPLAGIRFGIVDQEVTTDESGYGYFAVDKAGSYEVELLTAHEEHPNYRFEFDRWQVEVFDTHREVSLPKDALIQVGFSVSYQVTTSFVDTDGNPIDPQRIEALTFQSSHGAVLTLEPGRPYWFQANRIMRRSTGLEAVPIQYSLQSVLIDGANVVNRGQQKFFAEATQDNWKIELIFFPAKFAAKDALFGWRIGSGINLTYPNGQVVFHPFDEQGEVVLTALPRGDYRVQVADAPGMAPLTPVAISRFQDVKLLVISYLDMGLFVGCGALVAAALLLVGRPTLLRKFAARRRPAPEVPSHLRLLPGSNDLDGLRLIEDEPVAHMWNNNGYRSRVAKRGDLWPMNGAETQRHEQNGNHEIDQEPEAATLE